MPHKQKHRGARPGDHRNFSRALWAVLQQAVEHYSWLLSRNYADRSALKIVGDHFQLNERQRKAVMRSSCPNHSLEGRKKRETTAGKLRGQRILIDGFNLIITVESALSGGFLFDGRDGCRRDLASVHSSYKKVMETPVAIELCVRAVGFLQPGLVYCYLDAPVSNSKRLAGLIRESTENGEPAWNVVVCDQPDRLLMQEEGVVITSDSVILDNCHRWFNGARHITEGYMEGIHVVPMAP